MTSILFSFQCVNSVFSGEATSLTSTIEPETKKHATYKKTPKKEKKNTKKPKSRKHTKDDASSKVKKNQHDANSNGKASRRLVRNTAGADFCKNTTSKDEPREIGDGRRTQFVGDVGPKQPDHPVSAGFHVGDNLSMTGSANGIQIFGYNIHAPNLTFTSTPQMNTPQQATPSKEDKGYFSGIPASILNMEGRKVIIGSAHGGVIHIPDDSHLVIGELRDTKVKMCRHKKPSHRETSEQSSTEDEDDDCESSTTVDTRRYRRSKGKYQWLHELGGLLW